MSDHYNLLGIGPQATPAEIRGAFRRLAKLCHPDTQPHLPAPQQAELQRRFILLAQAYAVLSDPARRLAYDRLRPLGSGAASAPGAPRAKPAAGANPHTAPRSQPGPAAGAARNPDASGRRSSGRATGPAGAQAGPGAKQTPGAQQSAGAPHTPHGAGPGGPAGTHRGRGASARPGDPSGSAGIGRRGAGSTPGHSPAPDATLGDLVQDLEQLLTRLGVGLPQPWEGIASSLLEWARGVFREGANLRRGSQPGPQPSTAGQSGAAGKAARAATAEKRGPAPPRATARQQAADVALEAELAALRRQVRAGRRFTPQAPTVDEELAALKQRLGRH